MATAAASTGAWKRNLALIAVPALAVFVYSLLDPTILADGDSNWHVATGRWILAHHAVPTTDPFSYTAVGRPWVTHEWLSEVLMALSWRAAGWSGVVVLTGACAAAAVALMAAELRRSLTAFSAIVALGLSFGLLERHMLARPHIITLPLLALWLIELVEARRKDRLPPLWLLPLMLLWSNLHGSFIFGLVFTGVFAIEATLAAGDRRLAVASKWGAFGLAAGALSLVTPNGVPGFFYPLYVMSMKNLQTISEWQAVSFMKPTSLGLAMFLTLFVCLYRGVKVPAVRLGLLLLLLYMSLQHIRLEIVLAVAAPLLLAEPVGRALEPELPEPLAAAWPPWRSLAPPLAVVAAVVAVLGAWRLATPETRRDSVTVPVTALAHVPASLRAKPVFNDYGFGGWLIFEGVRPFMDGRSDMYGDDLLELYVQTQSADPRAVATAFGRYGVAWTILAPRSPLVARLDATPGWRRLYADRWAVVQVRSPPNPAAVVAPAPGMTRKGN
jgi:hypothetical protein